MKSRMTLAVLGLLGLTAVFGSAPAEAREAHFPTHPTMRQVRAAPVVVQEKVRHPRHHMHHARYHKKHGYHHAYKRGYRHARAHHVRLHGGRHMDLMRFKSAFYHSR